MGIDDLRLKRFVAGVEAGVGPERGHDSRERWTDTRHNALLELLKLLAEEEEEEGRMRREEKEEEDEGGGRCKEETSAAMLHFNFESNQRNNMTPSSSSVIQ